MAIMEEKRKLVLDRIEDILEEYTQNWESIPIKVKSSSNAIGILNSSVLRTFEQNQTIIRVAPPYVMNVSKYTKNRELEENKKNWRKIKRIIGLLEKEYNNRNLREDFDFQYYWETHLGKGTSQLIQSTLEYIVNEETNMDVKINLNTLKIKLTSDGLREFLVNFGIGVDCSGFVSRAIATIMTDFKIDEKKQEATLGRMNNEKEPLRLKTNASTLRKKGSIKLFAFDNINEVGNFNEIQSGDIIMQINPNKESDFHILIIAKTGKDKEGHDYFTTVESSSEESKGKGICRRTHYDFENFYYREDSSRYYQFARPKAFVDLFSNLEDNL